MITPDGLRERLRTLVHRDGERIALAKLKVSRPTLARALAGLSVRDGSIALMRLQLDHAESEDRRQTQAAEAAFDLPRSRE